VRQLRLLLKFKPREEEGEVVVLLKTRGVGHANNRDHSHKEYTGRLCVRWNHAKSRMWRSFICISLDICAALGTPAEHQNKYRLDNSGGRGGGFRGGRGHGTRY
jgi:hypothetical protein